MLAQSDAKLGGVVEEDVDPDAWVRARHTGHVAEGPARRGQRLVPVDAKRARVVQDDVRESVRKMAREREQPVVRPGIDSDRHRAERTDKAM